MIIKRGDDSGKIVKIVDPDEKNQEKLRIAVEKNRIKKEDCGNKSESDCNPKQSLN